MVLFWLFSGLWGPPGGPVLGSKTSPRTIAFTLQNISPGYLQNPQSMKQFWFLNFDALILILILEWSMGIPTAPSTIKVCLGFWNSHSRFT
jgi:hypothetical protein